MLHLLDRCRDHFQRVCCPTEPSSDETSSSSLRTLTSLFVERCRVAMWCVEAVSICLFDGPIIADTTSATTASREGQPVGLFAALAGGALPRQLLPEETPLPCSDIIVSYLDWVHSSFKALAPILIAHSSISSSSTLATFARQQLSSLVAAWQRIIAAAAAAALSLSTPATEILGSYNDQTPGEYGAVAPQLQSYPSPSHSAEAVLAVWRRSVQVSRFSHR